MIVCIQKSTGKMIESQSNATNGTMIQNALQYGYTESDLEEKEVSEVEHKILIEARISEIDKIKNELISLDSVLPRCVEDLIIDESIIPTIMKERLFRKRELRTQLNAH